MQHSLVDQHFKTYKAIKESDKNEWIASKEHFLSQIHLLPEKWKKL